MIYKITHTDSKKKVEQFLTYYRGNWDDTYIVSPFSSHAIHGNKWWYTNENLSNIQNHTYVNDGSINTRGSPKHIIAKARIILNNMGIKSLNQY